MKARFGIIEVPRSIASAVENAKLAEKSGFDWFGVADSQSLFRELFVTLAMVGQATERMMIGPSVTNPLTRHPAVAASAVATISEMHEGRVVLGLGSGDSEILNLGLKPAKVDEGREYLIALRGLLKNGEAEFQGRTGANSTRFPAGSQT